MQVGLFGLIFLAMFVLKLAGPMASASWWLVTLPLWGPFAFFIAMFALTIFSALSFRGLRRK